MKKLTIWISGLLLLTSCGVGNLTTQQQKELIKIDKEMDKLWINYSYKIDSLYIQRDSIIQHKEGFKPCCIKTSNNVYKHEGLTIDNNQNK
jgi:sulfur relay (sulfurtransferase) DsrF/TusC family protein